MTGDIFDSKSLVPHLTGQDAVLSGLGAPGVHIFKVSLYIDSMKAITAAMNEANVKRLICITAFYTKRNYSTPNIWYTTHSNYLIILKQMMEHTQKFTPFY